MKNHSPNSKLPAARTAGTMGLQRTEGAPLQVQFLQVPGQRFLLLHSLKKQTVLVFLTKKEHGKSFCRIWPSVPNNGSAFPNSLEANTNDFHQRHSRTTTQRFLRKRTIPCANMNCLIPKDTFLDGFIREYTEKARPRAPASCFKAPAGFL